MSLETDGEDASIFSRFKIQFVNPDSKPTFVCDPVEDNRCPVCQSILLNAVQLACGHHVCQSDVGRILQRNNTGECPVQSCGMSFTKKDIFPDVCKRRDISNLTVYCPNKDLGCPERFPWKNVSKHESACRYLGHQCDRCGQKILLSELEDHMSNTCENKEIPCQYCQESISIRTMKHHQNSECRLYPIDCENKCGIREIPREQIENHLAECPLRKVECSFSKYGCTFEGTEEQTNAHKEEAIITHLDTILNGIINNNNQHGTLLTEMKLRLEKVIQENAKIPKLMAENEKLQKESKANKMSIQEMKKVLASNGERVIQTGRKLEDKASVETVTKLQHEVAVIKGVVQESNKRMSNIERSGMTVGYGAGGNTSVIQQAERQVGLLDIRMSELDLRLQLQETVNHDGVLMWKLKDYGRRKRDAINGKTLSLYSQPFYTSKYGYKLCGRVYLNGDGTGKGTHLSFFMVVMRGDFDALLPWPFQLPVTMKLLDQNGTRQHIAEHFMPSGTSNSFKRPTTEMNVACGVPCFVLHSKLETETYLKDDTLFLRIEVDCSNAQAFY